MMLIAMQPSPTSCIAATEMIHSVVEDNVTFSLKNSNTTREGDYSSSAKPFIKVDLSISFQLYDMIFINRWSFH